MKFDVVTTTEAECDIERLFEFMLEPAESTDDLSRALLAAQTLRSSIKALSDVAPRCRKAGDGRDPFLRELVIPFGRTGYLALFEIVGDTVVVAAVRHQREDDYH